MPNVGTRQGQSLCMHFSVGELNVCQADIPARHARLQRKVECLDGLLRDVLGFQVLTELVKAGDKIYTKSHTHTSREEESMSRSAEHIGASLLVASDRWRTLSTEDEDRFARGVHFGANLDNSARLA